MSSPVGAEAGPGARVTRRRVLLVLAALLAVVMAVVLVRGLAQDADEAASSVATAPARTAPADEPSGEGAPEPSPSEASPEPDAPAPEATDRTPVPAATTLPEPLPARPLTEEVPLGEEAVTRIAALEAVEGEPQGVGQVAGPALRFTIELENRSTEPLPLDTAVVNVTYGPQGLPATELSGPGRAPFTGELAPGESATGTYVFLVPVDAREAVSVSLEYRFGAPIAVFTGSASAAPAG